MTPLCRTIAVPIAAALAVAASACKNPCERAVERSERGNPDILDTLAEVRFAMGDILGALSAIDEAILIARDEPYFREQRKRFTGERAVDDRPDAPALPWILRRPDAWEGEEEELPFDPDEGVAI